MKKFCMKCHKEKEHESSQKCECGCRFFVYGEFKFTDKEVICICDGKSFSISTHIDLEHKSLTNLACDICNKVISVEQYIID